LYPVAEQRSPFEANTGVPMIRRRVGHIRSGDAKRSRTTSIGGRTSTISPFLSLRQ
jgi:hypothetical protein